MNQLFIQFVSPGFLFALLAVSIPVIIHLFHFRRFRRVFFPNVSFLQQLSDESKKQSRIKHLLVLAARVLAISALVLAFARPYIPVGGERTPSDGNLVSIYIDNSFSMDAIGTSGRLLDQAKARTLEIASVYQAADRFLLLTNDFEGRHQRFVSREELESMVREVSISSRVRTLEEVMERKSVLFSNEPSGNGSSYYISDFQKNTTSLSGAEPDSLLPAYFIPLQAQRHANVYIDTCWFDSPVKLAGQTVRMIAGIRNDGDESLSGQPVRLFINGVQRALASYDLSAGGETRVELNWTIGSPGFYQGWVEILDYPVTFDDRLYFSYEVLEQTPVLSIDQSGENRFLRALFGQDSIFQFRSTPSFSIDYSSFPMYNLIILNGLDQLTAGLSAELADFVYHGGSLAVFPGPDIDLVSYREFSEGMGLDIYTRLDTTSTRVSTIDELHLVYRDVFDELPDQVDLPAVSGHYQITGTAASRAQHLLLLQNGNPLLSYQAVGDGEVFLSAVPLDERFSNFPRHTLFVPTMFNIAIQSQSLQPTYHTMGSDIPLQLREASIRSGEVLKLRGEDMEMVPGQRRSGNRIQLLLHDQVANAGNYMLHAGEEPLKALSFNYDRRESQMDAYDPSALSALILDAGFPWIHVIDAGTGDFERAFQEYRAGHQLWRLFLMLALAFLLVEVLLLRFWR
jgi:hypothetical protein